MNDHRRQAVPGGTEPGLPICFVLLSYHFPYPSCFVCQACSPAVVHSYAPIKQYVVSLVKMPVTVLRRRGGAYRVMLPVMQGGCQALCPGARLRFFCPCEGCRRQSVSVSDFLLDMLLCGSL